MSDLAKEEGGQSRETLRLTIETYFPTLYRIAFLRMKNEADAEDVVQEVFFRYMRSGMVFVSKEHEKAWFIKVTLNCCRKLWKSSWMKYRAALPEEGEAVALYVLEQTRHGGSLLPERRAEQRTAEGCMGAAGQVPGSDPSFLLRRLVRERDRGYCGKTGIHRHLSADEGQKDPETETAGGISV